MELASFSENIVIETIERNGESVELRINIDAIVPDYFDALAERLAPLNERLRRLVTHCSTLRWSTPSRRFNL